jgi:hypothetical protein
MAVTSQIALRIAGTKQRQAGFAPLVTVGVLAGGEGNNMDQVPLVNDKPGYIIKHTEEYILYLLIDRRVKSFDADAPGVLSIALSLAREVQLAEGRSPYTLLKEVYETFRSTYMTPVGDERDSFVNTDIDNDIFREIVQRYPTEPRVGAFIPMNPAGLSGTLCVPESKMEAFFRDTQYPEFAVFKDIHVSPSCQTYPGLEGLEIPRPVSYEIYVNGNPTGNKLVRADDMYRSGLQSTRFVEYDMISFTLHEVLSAPGNQLKIGTATVQLDAASGHIHCTIPKREIMYKLAIDLVGGNDNDQSTIRNGFKSGKIRILLGSEDITDLKEIKYSEVSGKEFTLYPSATEKHLLSVKSSLEPNKRELRLKISIVRKTITPAAQPKTSHQPQQPKQNITPEPPQYSEPEPPKSFMGRLGMDWKSLILGLILGLLLGIAGGWYIGSPKEQKGQTPTPTPTEDPALKGHEGEVESLVVDTPQEESSVEETITNADNASVAADHAIGQASERNNPPQTTGENSGTGKNGRSTSTPTTRTSARTDNPPATPTTEETDKAAATATLKAEILSLINGATPDDLIDGKTIKTIRSKWDNQPGLLTPTEMNKIENLCAKRTGIDRGRAKTFFETKKPFANWDALISAKIE